MKIITKPIKLHGHTWVGLTCGCVVSPYPPGFPPNDPGNVNYGLISSWVAGHDNITGKYFHRSNHPYRLDAAEQVRKTLLMIKGGGSKPFQKNAGQCQVGYANR